MANQMTPAEMRETAKRLREARFPEQGGWRTSDIEAGADALDRLAAVIDLCEAELATTDPDGLTPSGQVARGILRAARGDTTDGTPIVANEDGAGAMHDITRFVDVEPWPLMGIRKEEADDR